eukprot:CAMPEP_0113540962 /NCGR_PEP_ID=MMETSP0015_2-20120614/8766_1 /TAXON_ID=2838 /ORGANISM="Odontella" /LENGTH=506 /DNA_ID=CAMNT_0000440813 /DNA_START=145 /DNA_END=1665 /DNA_ORIENTATION=+ /assembly_acc=CAM_ASM_000160
MVKFTAAAVGALVLFASCSTTDAFTYSGGPSRRGCRSIAGGEAATRLSMVPPTPEESAKALSDYMAKSHEEKLRAVKDAEAKSAAIIESLKSEIGELKSSRETSIVQAAPAAPLPPPPEGSREELAVKLVSYQKFMSEYIVKAQEQKLAAVKAAEAAAEQKFQEKLLLLGAAPEPPASAAPAVVAAPSENKLFAERNANVSAAAKAGKSRWGDMENQRAAGSAATLSVEAAAAAAPVAVPPADVPPEVEAADHGLRADGGVSGPSLAERVALGASVGGEAAPASSAPAPAAPVAAVSKNQAIFQQRNARVTAAAQAGKSRWGEMETERAADFAARALSAAAKSTEATPVSVAVVDVPVSPEVEAADHGLRADGGVGGLTLAQRVALGANANGAVAATAAVPVPALSKTQVIFQQRNARVSAAGHAGKSRWGIMEIERATEYAVNALPAAGGATQSVSVERIEAADHGLRADGGVGGPSLGERVNLGAQLLQTEERVNLGAQLLQRA